MKQYKLLKDLPGINTGTIGVKHEGSNGFVFEDNDGVVSYEEGFMKLYPDFFEEVKELEKLFTIEDMNISWHRAWNNDVSEFNRFVSNEYPQHIDQLKHLK